ncbi:hypothetical protein M407DRAFT_148360 [Tulasnella calospora MUT 4182]|uniref:Uncharacterized protein n=1 Tax=Tulasnella calospora MUT 4182 TaxID=1051891 RepID=A0A0C3LD68_9AGAM|nr:hypothetical protein M407DRAFT_148360 [Tulasnella calospora MUT 4182]
MSIHPSYYYGRQAGFVEAYATSLDYQYSEPVAGYPGALVADPRHYQTSGNVTIHANTLNVNIHSPSTLYLHNAIVEHQPGTQQYLAVPLSPGYTITLTPTSSRTTQIVAVEPPAVGLHISPVPSSAQIGNPPKRSTFRRFLSRLKRSLRPVWV